MSQRKRKKKPQREKSTQRALLSQHLPVRSSEYERTTSLKGGAKVHGERGILGKKCPEAILIIRKDTRSRLCCPLSI